MCAVEAWKGFEQQSEMIPCEKIPLATAGEEGIKERMKTGDQLRGCCSGPGKRELVTWSTAGVVEKGFEICGQKVQSAGFADGLDV